MNDLPPDSHTEFRTRLIPNSERLQVLPRHFRRYMMRFESAVYSFAEHLCSEYRGAYWEFYEFSEGGFYMAPTGATRAVRVDSNGFEGTMSADAFGITVCLFACSHLSLSCPSADDVFGRHFHLLRDFALEHAEAGLIFGAID
jgi:hypothetical protein